VIVDPAALHLLEREEEVRPRVRVPGALEPAQLGEEERRVGEFLAGAEAAVGRVAGALEPREGLAQQRLAHLAGGAGAARERRSISS